MVKVFYQSVFIITLNLFFISPSFSMNVPEISMDTPANRIVKLSTNIEEKNPTPYSVKTIGEAYALGRFYLNDLENKNSRYKVYEVRNYFRLLTSLGKNDVHRAQFPQEALHAQFNYARLCRYALHPESSDEDHQLAEKARNEMVAAGLMHPQETYALGKYFLEEIKKKSSNYKVMKAKDYFFILTLLGENDVHRAQFSQEVLHALFNYARLCCHALHPESSDQDNQLAEQAMRKAAIAGSKDAQMVLETMF